MESEKLKQCRALNWNSHENEYNIPCKVFSPDTFCQQHETERKNAHIKYHYVQREMQNQKSTTKRRLDVCAQLELAERNVYQKRFRFSLDYGHQKWMEYLHDIIKSYEIMHEQKIEERQSLLNLIFDAPVCPRKLKKCMLGLDSSKKYEFIDDSESDDWNDEAEITQNRQLAFLDLAKVHHQPRVHTIFNYDDDDW